MRRSIEEFSMRAAFAATLALPLLALLAVPAMAQDAPGDRVNQLIVYGDDECPAGKDDEIVICARKAESERYRIPSALRESSSPQNEAWNNKVLAYEMVGRSGIMSCSPSGPGGSLGCTQRMIDTAYQEKRENGDVRFSELIAAERARRLATIDEDAADTQARVEVLEKEYMSRQAAQAEAAADAAEAGKPLPEPK
jgi:hypothetical protein